jgi:CheY-like chemotaxis protein
MTIYREKTSLQRLIEDVEKMVAGSYAQKGLWLRTAYAPGIPDVFADTTRVRQVILNLVTNGLRFTDKGGVTISVEDQLDSLLVKVNDTGTGIAEEDIPKVFEAFRQVGQDSWRRREGSGLGLAISKQFIELHGGKMWLESDMEKGTTFFFTLPLIDANQTLEPIVENQDWRERVRAVDEEQEPLALLLTSDSLTSRLLHQSLDEFNIVPVNQIEELPEMVATLYPQAVFVDKSVPLEDRVRLRDLPYDLPVIGISLPGIAEGFELPPENLSDYLVKPVEREDMVSAVQRLGKGVTHFLVVDDDPAMVRFVTQALKAVDTDEAAPLDYEFLSANSGAEALAHLKTQQVDAILLDLDLPDINGWDVLQEIHKNEATANLPVIIISAMDFPQTLYTNGRQVFDVMMRRSFSKHEMSAVLSAILDSVNPIYPRATDSNGPTQSEDPAA